VTWPLSPKSLSATPENVGSLTVLDEPAAGWVILSVGAIPGAVIWSERPVASQAASEAGVETVT
jgi:hypothetical protein